MADRAPKADTLRFAVAAFGSWGELRDAVQAYEEGDPLKTISCLALQDVLAGQMASFLPANQAIRSFSFSDSPSPVACTSGVVAQCLAKRVGEGAHTLAAALGAWLIARHASQISHAVHEGKIVLFLELLAEQDEHRAYRVLLGRSAGPVGVHDFRIG